MLSVPPQIMPFDFGDEPTNTGDTVGVQCLVNKGDLPMEIRWVLNSSPIVSGQNGISIVKLSQRTSTLNINSVEGLHRGIFKCVVSNAAGTVEYSDQLNVNGLLAASVYGLFRLLHLFGSNPIGFSTMFGLLFYIYPLHIFLNRPLRSSISSFINNSSTHRHFRVYT